MAPGSDAGAAGSASHAYIGCNAAGFGPGRNKTGALCAVAVTPQPAAARRSPMFRSSPIAASGAARTLVVQLQPIELGTVTARLRLTPEGMHIQLMAENQAMAEHLAKDHDMLGKALQRAGVADDASSVTISVIDRSSAASSTADRAAEFVRTGSADRCACQRSGPVRISGNVR